MGTSASSNGPGPGVSFDPPWLDDINSGEKETPGIENTENDKLNQNSIIAPKARFGNARRALGDYVRSGSRNALRKSLGHYSKTGMGGAKNISRRMRSSVRIASNMFNTFQALRNGDEFELGRTLSELKQRGADAAQIVDAIVKYVCPTGGSLDEALSRRSASVALTEFLSKNPYADFLQLSEDEIWKLTSSYLGIEVFHRIQTDIGQAFEKADIPYPERIERMNEMREFIQVEISTQMNKIRSTNDQKINIEKLFSQTIRNTFETYEVEI